MSNEMIELLIKSFWETSYMVVASTLLASLIGIPLGIIRHPAGDYFNGYARQPHSAERSR